MARHTDGLAEHQKACVAQCLTNEWIDYGKVASYSIESEVTAAETRRGMCGGFAAMTASLLQCVGVDAKVESTTNFNDGEGAHAYNRIVFGDGRKVYFEPQNWTLSRQGCVFLE
jgi:hypothetical protein